jgi:methylamine--corrinoid protein Co-methyltransferase
MPNLIDFMERATSGPIVLEDDFNMKRLIPITRKIVKEFNIEYTPEDPVPADDGFADRLFEAAIEFLIQTGIYCDDTNRIIHFERDEIMDALENLPGKSFFGEGRDRSMFTTREPEDARNPWCHVGTGIVATSEDIALAQVAGYGRIPQAKSISIPAFNRIRGMQVVGGSPLEIHASIRAVQAGRKALTNAGRPGLPIMNLISSATTTVGTIAGSHPAFGLRASDGWLIDFLAEMKVNFETLNRLAFIQVTNGNIGSTALPILGGYAGGAPGTALVMTAYYLLGILLFQGTYHLTGPVHFRFGCSTTRDSLWVFSMVGRATSRNIRYPAIALGYGAAGPQTKMYFYEAAAFNLSCVTSGYAGVQTLHPAKAIVDDAVTPTEARFCAEMAHSLAGMKADRASELVNQLLDKYEGEVEKAPIGKRYQECYDLKRGKPSDDYLRLYEEVKDELAGLGISLR